MDTTLNLRDAIGFTDSPDSIGPETSVPNRPGQPNEVAPAYVFLASDEASYISGQVVHPNRGEIVNG